MNLTEEVKLSIKNELKKQGLDNDDSLFDQVVVLMEKKKQSYQSIITELANAYKQQKANTSSNNFAFNSVGTNSFKERLENTSKAVTNQILQSLIAAEQDAYKRYFSGDYDASMFPMEEITGHSVMSNLKALTEA